eukprot:UN06108
MDIPEYTIVIMNIGSYLASLYFVFYRYFTTQNAENHRAIIKYSHVALCPFLVFATLFSRPEDESDAYYNCISQIFNSTYTFDMIYR